MTALQVMVLAALELVDALEDEIVMVEKVRAVQGRIPGAETSRAETVEAEALTVM